MNLSDAAITIIATALIVGVPSLVAALASLSNRKHLRTGNGSSAGEYLPIIAASVSTLGTEQARVREELALSQVAQATALRDAAEDVKAEIAKAREDWTTALKEHTESDQANFEELRSLIAPSDPTP